MQVGVVTGFISIVVVGHEQDDVELPLQRIDQSLQLNTSSNDQSPSQ